jgi:hypothetical protein
MNSQRLYYLTFIIYLFKMDKELSNVITKDLYFVIIDKKNNRKIVNTVANPKVKLGKREVNVTFFENKRLNTFWDIEEKEYKEVTHQEFFNNDTCNYLFYF